MSQGNVNKCASTTTIATEEDRSSKMLSLPAQFLDCHHHFLDTSSNGFQQFLGSLIGMDATYLPDDYQRDVVQVLAAVGVQVVGSVHVECMPSDGVAEAAWVNQLVAAASASSPSKTCAVQAIVASCDLAASDAAVQLQHLATLSPRRVKGIRWILDYDGPYKNGKNATHVATTRHLQGGGDYLRGTAFPAFEQGFALLEQYEFSFDLQCAPAQLPAAAALCARYPNIPVVLDHLGKPRTVLFNDADEVDMTEIKRWKHGMQAMAALPHVYCKISMLGYAVPGWCRSSKKTAVLCDLVRYTVDLFGARRCMVGLNWWKDGATSDADGLSSVGPTPVEFLQHCVQDFFVEYSDEDLRHLFCETAQRFYRISCS